MCDTIYDNESNGMVARMEIQKIEYEFSICKVADYAQVDLEQEYCFIAKTEEEKSLVCISDSVPDNVLECNNGWKAFRIQGVLDFSLVGVLSRISTLLADSGIGIFAISTYNTDYILTRREHYDRALRVLSQAGYRVI